MPSYNGVVYNVNRGQDGNPELKLLSTVVMRSWINNSRNDHHTGKIGIPSFHLPFTGDIGGTGTSSLIRKHPEKKPTAIREKTVQDERKTSSWRY